MKLQRERQPCFSLTKSLSSHFTDLQLALASKSVQACSFPRIRRGKIRILIDDGSGNPVPVGPIQLSTADAVEELQARVCLSRKYC